MIYAVCQELNNFFHYSLETSDIEFSGNTLTGVFDEEYLTGQYIHVVGSILNDGVYKVVSATSTVITVEETFTDESQTGIKIYGMIVPSDFLTTLTEIEAYTPTDGVSSESIDDWSVSYVSDGSWQSVFGRKLAKYKKVGWK